MPPKEQGLSQCCGNGYEMEEIPVCYDIKEAVRGKDIVCTASLPAESVNDFKRCQVAKSIMDLANAGAVLNPCPPFFRGVEVSEDVIASDYFVGYGVKKYLLEIQQAVMVFCLSEKCT